MTKAERQITIEFLEDFRKDLLKQVFFNLQKGKKTAKADINVINEITKQQFINKELTKTK